MSWMTELSSVEEAVRFFREEPGFDRLFRLFKKKCESLGRVGGSVKLSQFTEAELRSIANFYGTSYDTFVEKDMVRLKGFEQQLQKTRFEGVALHELLETYFGERLMSNKMKREQERAEVRAFFAKCADMYPAIVEWIVHVLQKPADARFIYNLERENRDRLQKMIACVAKAMSQLPGKGEAERLPLFAQRVTGNPHAFDVQGEQGRLFLHALAVHRARKEGEAVRMPNGSEEMNDLLQYAGLLRDDLHNFVTCAGLLAETARGVHPVWREAALSYTVWHVPVRELVKTVSIYPYRGRHVWIVENSGVYSAILDACPEAPIVCTHGQFKLATWLLLDRITRHNVVLYYSGDYDPEGLRMAQNLKDRYREHIQFWRMDVENYRSTKPQKKVGQDRLKKLERITHPELLPVASEMKRLQAAGYQEALTDSFIHDIRCSL